MSKVFINESSLSAIGDAIREKTGGTELLTLAEMPGAIAGITSGGGGGVEVPEEVLMVTGDCNYRYANGAWDWFLNAYGDRITTQDISNAEFLFSKATTLTAVPFDLNFAANCNCSSLFNCCFALQSIPSVIDFNQVSSYISFSSMFYCCYNLEEIGTLKNLYPSHTGNMFESCHKLRALPTFENVNTSRLTSNKYASTSSMFFRCYSLREVDGSALEVFRNDAATTASYSLYNRIFGQCSTLEKITNLPVVQAAYTQNAFSSAFENCSRLSELTFKMVDGAPQTAKWAQQVIDLTGAGFYPWNGWEDPAEQWPDTILDYNSGITTDKRVYDDATYQALKDDPDWFAIGPAYSRYNHDSAVNTINSLPDCTSSGVANIIQFLGEAGSATDGGAIRNLTEEEIAVATAKGWTVEIIENEE